MGAAYRALRTARISLGGMEDPMSDGKGAA
jgi:hypothetical protein